MPSSGLEVEIPQQVSFLEKLKAKFKAAALRPKALVISLLVLFLFLVAVAYFCRNWNLGGRGRSKKLVKVDWGKISQSAQPSRSGSVTNPINGLLYTEEQAEVWRGRRPMAVMVNNHLGARPQTGLAEADLVYEAVAEGGIPRFLAIFHSRTPEKVGSVRSARVYFVDWAREYDAWYAHWGGAQVDPNDPAVCNPAADAFTHMRTVFVSSIDQMVVGSAAFWREPRAGLATEHTGFASVPKLYQAGYNLYPDQKRDFEGLEPWRFKEDAPPADRAASQSISFNFWDDPDHKVLWEYDSGPNDYKRFQGGQPHLDAATGKPLRAKDVIIVFMKETRLFDKKAHLLYGTLGGGRAMVFLDGKAVKAKWERPKVEDRTKFFDSRGEEISFNRGPIWIEVLPLEQTVAVQ